MTQDPYRLLQQRLHELPNGFPPTEDGADLRLLARLFTPEEAALAATLRLTLETAADIAARTGADAKAISKPLKAMATRGLIHAGRAAGGLGFGLLPFIVGFYENQGPVLDAALARLVEDYYRQAFEPTLAVAPQFHRVIPVEQSVDVNMEVRPYESAAEIVAAAQSWGVVDCICRKQKALIGEACGHPLDVCMTLSPVPNAFDNAAPFVRKQTREEALATLRRAAEAGLVATVSNSQEGLSYICNCCTCGCGILRGVAELGMANAVARSAFLCRVDEDACGACGLCADRCQFGALTVDLTAQVDAVRCAGCGACTLVCPEHALSLVRRPEEDILPPPVSSAAWLAERAAARGLDLGKVL
jgi:Na+-translocating ferredoxin:NAD+ oxidoreductase subunit B